LTLSEMYGAVFFEIIWRVPTRGRTAEYKFSYGLKAVVGVCEAWEGAQCSASLLEGYSEMVCAFVLLTFGPPHAGRMLQASGGRAFGYADIARPGEA